jgi:hypothetical protein
LNPTNCSPTSLNADITGVGGDLLSSADDSLFQTSDYFQVGDCGRLGFKPQIFFKLKGHTTPCCGSACSRSRRLLSAKQPFDQIGNI